jgi:hypothetical protein
MKFRNWTHTSRPTLRRLFRFPVLAASFVTLVAVRADAGTFQELSFRKAADAVAITEPSHCRPWPHWHQWGWGRGCGEIQMPRERRGWRFRDWRRLR